MRLSVALLLFVAAVFGQTASSSLTGVVTDAAEAVIPGVAITARNVDTNIVWETTTNEEGLFVIPNLVSGSYEVTAEATGFRRYLRKNVQLESSQALRLDIQMEVGAVSESVTVTAELAPLNTEAGALKGDIITPTEIAEVPLEGRNIFDLAYLVPGVSPKADGANGDGMIANGARQDNFSYYVEGVNTRSPWAGGTNVSPNLDSIQEFKIETSGYSAEYGRYAGGVMHIVQKSGTNQFHGAAGYYFRNDMFDARGFFDQTKLDLSRRQIGGSIGGPILRDKLFFMGSAEHTDENSDSTRINRVPTALEKQGDFTASVDNRNRPVKVKDPLNKNAPFPGNIIPASRFHPSALKLLPYYPDPNMSGVFNYAAVGNAHRYPFTIAAKVDYRFSDKDLAGFRLTKNDNHQERPWAGSTLGTFNDKEFHENMMLGLSYTRTISPRLVFEARGGLDTHESGHPYFFGQGMNVLEELGFSGSTTDPKHAGFPSIQVQDYATLGNNAYVPFFLFPHNFSGSAKFTWVVSKHTLKWGVEALRVRTNYHYAHNTRGTYKFHNRWTGHAIGDTLLGLLNNTNRRLYPAPVYLRAFGAGLYFDDNWKVTRDLTLNLGLRYEYQPPALDRYDRIANFIPEYGKIVISDDRAVTNFEGLLAEAGLTNLVALREEYGLPRALVKPNNKMFAPRFGFAWRPFHSERMVIRGGYGIFFAGGRLNSWANRMMDTFPFTVKETYNRDRNNPELLNPLNAFPEELKTLQGTTSSAGWETDPAPSYLQSYNFTIERDFGRGNVLEIGYMGSKGTHLSRNYNLNQPIRLREYFDAGLDFPKPYPELGSIDYFTLGSNSNYNAGNVSLRRRTRGDLFYRVSYVFSKSIDEVSQEGGASYAGFTGAIDPTNLSLERARSTFDINHQFIGSFYWRLPVGQGKPLLGSANKWVDGFLGGWQLSGTATLYSGQPFTVKTQGANTSLGESQRPNRIASGKQEDIPGAGRRGVDYPWFKLDDFEEVPPCDAPGSCPESPYGFSPFAPGNSGRNILNGPGLTFLNAALAKNFRPREGHNIQVRWEVFNVSNTPNFRRIQNSFNTNTGGLFRQAQTSGRGGPRQMQFAIRYTF